MNRFAGNVIPKAKEGKERIVDCGLRIADCGLRIVDCGLRIEQRSGFYLQMAKMRWLNGMANRVIVCKRVIF